MGTKKIDIYINEEKICSLDDDTPSFDDLIGYVIKNPDKDYTKLNAKYEDDKFDKAALEESLKSVIKSFLNDTKIDNEGLKTAIDSIEKKE